MSSALACRLGFWSAGLLSLTGIVYIAVVGAFIALHGLVMPATGAVQLFGGMVTILDAQLLLILMACIHQTAPDRMLILSRLALIFTALFDAMVSINRFVQLALAVLGCGSSALATLLFTLAFTYDHPNTPVLLQQLQPLFAVAGARVILGERLQRRYGLYLLGGLLGAGLLFLIQVVADLGLAGQAEFH